MRLQRGALVFDIIVLAMVAGIGYAIWHFGKDHIKSLMGWGLPALAVTDFKCEGEASGAAIRGAVRNDSQETLELRAWVQFKTPGDERIPYHTEVKPSPLEPGATGKFQMRVPMGRADVGKCTLLHFRDQKGRELLYAGG